VEIIKKERIDTLYEIILKETTTTTTSGSSNNIDKKYNGIVKSIIWESCSFSITYNNFFYFLFYCFYYFFIYIILNSETYAYQSQYSGSGSGNSHGIGTGLGLFGFSFGSSVGGVQPYIIYILCSILSCFSVRMISSNGSVSDSDSDNSNAIKLYKFALEKFKNSTLTVDGRQ
jgi:hypothetical protein